MEKGSRSAHGLKIHEINHDRANAWRRESWPFCSLNPVQASALQQNYLPIGYATHGLHSFCRRFVLMFPVDRTRLDSRPVVRDICLPA
ncbi:hypothetical protein [Agrobacterium tumefaciens]|uniref:hypothetical protein n=1 Tax=Agrobacterium tumefaciens TaxID=358 RepID=UPI003BA3AC0C